MACIIKVSIIIIDQKNNFQNVRFQMYFRLCYYERNSLENNNDHIYYRYIHDVILFYFSVFNISSLSTQYPYQLTLSQKNVLSNVINIIDLKITLNNKNK